MVLTLMNNKNKNRMKGIANCTRFACWRNLSLNILYSWCKRMNQVHRVIEWTNNACEASSKANILFTSYKEYILAIWKTWLCVLMILLSRIIKMQVYWLYSSPLVLASYIFMHSYMVIAPTQRHVPCKQEMNTW